MAVLKIGDPLTTRPTTFGVYVRALSFCKTVGPKLGNGGVSDCAVLLTRFAAASAYENVHT